MKVEFKGAWVPVFQLGLQVAPPAKNTFTTLEPGGVVMRTWAFKLLLPFYRVGADMHVHISSRPPRRPLLYVWGSLVLGLLICRAMGLFNWREFLAVAIFQGVAVFCTWNSFRGRPDADRS